MNLSKEAENELKRLLDDENINKDQLNRNLEAVKADKEKIG